MVLMVRVHTQQLALDWEEEVPAPAPLARQDYLGISLTNMFL